MIGVDVNAAINITEDREQFKQLLAKKYKPPSNCRNLHFRKRKKKLPS
jgi:hypothetical protein